MKRFLITILTILLMSTIQCNMASAKHLNPESYYQDKLCGQLSGQLEYLLPDNTRVDCLTSEYAIEIGFIDHKYEDVGQSLYYSLITGKKPAIATIIENPKIAEEHLHILQKLAEKYDIKIFILQP